MGYEVAEVRLPTVGPSPPRLAQRGEGTGVRGARASRMHAAESPSPRCARRGDRGEGRAGVRPAQETTMSDSSTGQTINTILRLGLDPALRAAGYKRRAHTFRQALPDGVWRVINVQGNRWNEGDQGRFTLNLGLHFPQVRAIMGDPPLTMPPKAWDCELRARIGRLMPDR